jgi:hypothetical protein
MIDFRKWPEPERCRIKKSINSFALENSRFQSAKKTTTTDYCVNKSTNAHKSKIAWAGFPKAAQ